MVVTGSISGRFSISSPSRLPRGDARARTRPSSPSRASRNTARRSARRSSTGSRATTSPTDSGRPVPLPDLRRQVPDRLRRTAAAHDVRGQGALGHQGRADALAPEPGAPEEARCVRARLPERHRDIEKAFADYYRTTILSARPTRTSCTRSRPRWTAIRSTRPSRSTTWSSCFWAARIATSWTRSSTPAWPCMSSDLDEDQQVDFKGKAKAFTRTYDFLATILPYGVQEWEKLSIFLNFLMPSCPRRRKKTWPKASSKPSTWTATAPRRRR
jgi:hypothetical protein